MRYLSTLPILLTLWSCLSSCHGKIDVAPDKVLSNNRPKFNFLVRQLNPSNIIDTTKAKMIDTIKAELYIRQLDYTDEQERYKLIVTLPDNFDGLIYYKESYYRSGDWIFIEYKDLKDYTTVLNITQREKKTGAYSLGVVCSDSKDNSKTERLQITVF